MILNGAVAVIFVISAKSVAFRYYTEFVYNVVLKHYYKAYFGFKIYF